MLLASLDYIADKAGKLIRKYNTRNPYELCEELGIRIRYKDLGKDIKAYYFYQSRMRNVVLNTRLSEAILRVLVAHELGHDCLHKKIAMLRGFQEFDLFDMARPAEFEANIFAAEVLISDDEILELLNDEDKSFFSLAGELYIPAPLLDFKFRVLKHKGYRHKGYSIEPPLIANGDFLKNGIPGCYQEDDEC